MQLSKSCVSFEEECKSILTLSVNTQQIRAFDREKNLDGALKQSAPHLGSFIMKNAFHEISKYVYK